MAYLWCSINFVKFLLNMFIDLNVLVQWSFLCITDYFSRLFHYCLLFSHLLRRLLLIENDNYNSLILGCFFINQFERLLFFERLPLEAWLQFFSNFFLLTHFALFFITQSDQSMLVRFEQHLKNSLTCDRRIIKRLS